MTLCMLQIPTEIKRFGPLPASARIVKAG